jgi:large subunit ribosomal protein L4
MKADVYNLKNEVVGKTELPDGVFGVAWKPQLVKQVLVAQMANLRRPWAHAKGRSEVRGGGRKPWKQKGTGRARHGSIRSPLWRGGGKSHGPTNERDYTQKINKKMRRGAIFAVLSKKLADNEIRVFQGLMIDPPKTKALSAVLHTMLSLGARVKKFDVILVPERENRMIVRAARNLTKTKVLSPESLNVQDLLTYKNIFIDEKAVPEIAKHYSIS